jgi:hypothetical protein
MATEVGSGTDDRVRFVAEGLLSSFSHCGDISHKLFPLQELRPALTTTRVTTAIGAPQSPCRSAIKDWHRRRSPPIVPFDLRRRDLLSRNAFLATQFSSRWPVLGCAATVRRQKGDDNDNEASSDMARSSPLQVARLGCGTAAVPKRSARYATGSAMVQVRGAPPHAAARRRTSPALTLA